MSPFQWWLVRIINQYLHIFGGKFSQHFLAQNWADSSSHSLSISTFSPDTQRIQNRVRKAVCFFNKCNNDLTRYKSLGSDCMTANKFHYRPVKKSRSWLFCQKKRSLCAGSPRTTQPGWWWGTAAPLRRTPATQAAPPYSFFYLLLLLLYFFFDKTKNFAQQNKVAVSRDFWPFFTWI